MTLSIQRVPGSFAAEVFGVDLRRTLGVDEIARIEAALDRHAVLVFRDQRISDEQQIKFTLRFGAIENAAGGNVTKPYQRRLDMRINDVSNLDEHNAPLARDDRRRMFNLGNRLWHSDSSYRVVPARYSLLSARELPDAGGNTEFADM
ncbi:MAG: TauD/TfdA family dioxygenase, partial [Gammaproteobacteria bacterium]|nr:TauD/TfdA family dioxygenase [Gammaproteobacteria bacterium]